MSRPAQPVIRTAAHTVEDPYEATPFSRSRSRCPRRRLAGAAARNLSRSPRPRPKGHPDRLADHPVIGTWWTANDAPGPGVATAYAVFHADGIYLEVDPNIGVGVGVWRATGKRSAELTYVFQDIDPEPATTARGR